MRLPACLFIVALCGCTLQAQNLDATLQAKVDAALHRAIAETGATSVSVAIVENGAIAYRTAIGSADFKTQTPATPATRYQIASISKTFVAEAVLMLAQEGRLSLDDKVARWFPDLTDADRVTVRQLLLHTSGYPDHYPEGYPAGPKGRAATPDSIIEHYGRHPLLFAPGTQYHYSNLEYEMAGRIVEKASGLPLFAFVQQRILRPAGIDDALDLDTIPDGSRQLATGYIRDALGPLAPAPYEGPGWSFGSGQLVMTATDLAKWDVAFLIGSQTSAAIREQQTTRGKLADGSPTPSGIGLFVGGSGEQLRYYHSGQGLGFTAINMIYPRKDLAIAVLSNTSAGNVVGNALDQLTYLLVPPTKEEVYAREVFHGLQSGHPDRTTWSADLKSYMAGPRLAAYRDSLTPLGPVESFVARPVTVTDGLTTRDYDVVAGGRELRLHLLITAAGLLEDAAISDPHQR